MQKKIYEKLYDLALKIAIEAHKDQVDKAGAPYINHPIAVAKMVNKDEGKITALLHDVIEDSDITFDDLFKLGFPSNIVEAVIAITKMNNENYEEYIRRVMQNEIAEKVKIADLKHNSDLTRIKKTTAHDIKRTKKYEATLKKIQTGLYAIKETYDAETGEYRRYYSLDNNSLYFLSEFQDNNKSIFKYSIDVEEANDSHYLIDLKEMQRLKSYLFSTYEVKNLIVALTLFFRNNGEIELLEILNKAGVKFQQFHFDDYPIY